MRNLNNLLKLLLENDVDFVLVGGFAGAVYGSSLVTRDLDICAFCTLANSKETLIFRIPKISTKIK